MKIQPFKFIKGYLLIEIKGNYTERFLNLCRYHDIYLWNIENLNNNYRMNISINDFRKLKPIIRKTRTKVRILNRFGIPFFAFKYKTRKVFVLSALITIFFLYVLSFFVWQIELVGNHYISDESLMEYLNENNVLIGKRKNAIKCPEIVESLRADYNEIIWASAHLNGTKLKIHIKENESENIILKEANVKHTDNFYTNIISDSNGIIKNIVTRKGVPQIHEGDEVKKGEILVSGAVPILNDSKEIIDYNYQIPDADILAETKIYYEDKIMVKHKYLLPTKKKEYVFWIEINDTRIYFGKTKCKYEFYKYRTYAKKLNTRISFGIEERIKCNQVTQNYSIKDCQKILTNEYEKFCRNLEKKGVQILENSVRIYKEKYCILAKGCITILKPIGKMKYIKIDKQEGN